MSVTIVPLDVPEGLTAISATTPALFVPDAETAERYFEFFIANIRNKNTRRAYCTLSPQEI